MDFSVNYISFYDRMEKMNKLYDEIINNNYMVSDIKYLLFNYVNTEGDFNSFKYLVSKYGLIFENQMPMVDNNYIPQSIDGLLKQKIIQDIEELLNQKKKNKDLVKLKEKYMTENFKILTNIYGVPPKETIIDNIKISVNDFYNKYVKDLLNNYISISCLNNLEYGKLYDSIFLSVKIGSEEYLNNKDYSEIVSPVRIKKEMFEVFALNSPEVMQDFINQKIYKVLSDNINEINFIQIKELINKYNITENIEFIYFMALFFKKENFEIIRQFNLTRQEIKIIQDLKFAEELEGKLSDLEIHQEYSGRSKASLLLEYLLKNNNNLQTYLNNLNDVKIEVTSEDLLIMGVPESKSFSVIFNKLLEAKIKGELPDKTSELRFVRKLLMNNEV